jgi:hypothetical protein
VVSTCWTLLAEAAETGGGRLLHSAAVGGGAPVLETVADARERGDVVAVDGILNGTVNYILERLGRGAGFREALAEARLAGFAEENPAEDLSGADAAAKLRLIAAEAWGCDPAEVDVAAEPLDEAAVERIAASGERWIQHARVEHREGRIVAEVSLRPRRTVATLPHVPDEWNCAAVKLADGTVFRCRGRGAAVPRPQEPSCRIFTACSSRRQSSAAVGVMLTRTASAIEHESGAAAGVGRLWRPGAPASLRSGFGAAHRRARRDFRRPLRQRPRRRRPGLVARPGRRRLGDRSGRAIACSAWIFAADPTGRRAPSTGEQAEVLVAALDAIGCGSCRRPSSALPMAA